MFMLMFLQQRIKIFKYHYTFLSFKPRPICSSLTLIIMNIQRFISDVQLIIQLHFFSVSVTLLLG